MIQVLLFPFLLLWRLCCLLVLMVTLMLSVLWGFVIPSANRKTQAESTVEETFEEDYPVGIQYEWMKKPRHELSTIEKYKRLRLAYSQQMFTPATPKIRASWFAAQQQAR